MVYMVHGQVGRPLRVLFMAPGRTVFTYRLWKAQPIAANCWYLMREGSESNSLPPEFYQIQTKIGIELFPPIPSQLSSFCMQS